MPLCLVNGAFKPFKGPFHGNGLRGERSEKADRWSEGSGSIAQSPGRAGGREQEFSRVGMIYGAFGGIFGGEDPHVFPYLLLCVCPPPRNLPTSNRFPTTIFFTNATTDQINEEHARMLQWNYIEISHEHIIMKILIFFLTHIGIYVSIRCVADEKWFIYGASSPSP